MKVPAAGSVAREADDRVWGPGVNAERSSQLAEVRAPQGEGRWVSAAFVRASVLLPCRRPSWWPSEEATSWLARGLHHGSRNPDVRRSRREITVGNQASTVATGRRVPVWITSKATRVWLPHGNTNLDKSTDVFRLLNMFFLVINVIPNC